MFSIELPAGTRVVICCGLHLLSSSWTPASCKKNTWIQPDSCRHDSLLVGCFLQWIYKGIIPQGQSIWGPTFHWWWTAHHQDWREIMKNMRPWDRLLLQGLNWENIQSYIPSGEDVWVKSSCDFATTREVLVVRATKLVGEQSPVLQADMKSWGCLGDWVKHYLSSSN